MLRNFTCLIKSKWPQHRLNSNLKKNVRNLIARHFTLETSQTINAEYEKPAIPAFFEQSNCLDVLPVFKRIPTYMDSIALKDQHGKYDYYSLGVASQAFSRVISDYLQQRTEERVCFLCPNDASYVVSLWAIWMSGQIAVPLSPSYPKDMLEYYVKDCEAELIITTTSHADLLAPVAKKLSKKLYVIDDSFHRNAVHDPSVFRGVDINSLDYGKPNEFYDQADALILYTSGTTGDPKGVVITHKNIHAQSLAMIKSWKWSHNDAILHALPLNHTHGLINTLICPHYVGARCVMLPKFDVKDVWTQLLGINIPMKDRVNVFTAVPTIYTKLISEYERLFQDDAKMREHVFETLKKRMRLMISGSAPLPGPVFERWLDISGHRLLERYGMTEIGMCLSNLYRSNDVEIKGLSETIVPSAREPGCVGLPLPGVNVRIAERVDNSYNTLLECHGPSLTDPKQTIVFDATSTSATGELLVKSATVFREYFNRAEATKGEFTDDGWFRTGDTAQFDTETGLFKLLGRTSVDIIKTGGYKTSAIFIETVLLSHPEIKEVAVVGLDDATWGQKIVAIVVLKNPQTSMDIGSLREWAKSKLADYSLPKQLKLVRDIPRNAMGKVNKKQLVRDLFRDE